MKAKQYDLKEIKAIKSALRNGDVIAFPTDTVFGVGVRYDDEFALKRLKKAKRRDSHKPIPMMVSSLSQMEQVAVLDKRARCLVKAYMPGALTLILKRRGELPSYISNHHDTIAIRMPNDPFLLELLDQPLLVSSANLSGETPGRDDQEVLEQLEGRIDGIVKGKAKANIASTIVDLSTSEITILREGEISVEDIMKTLKEELDDESSSCM